MNQNYSFALTSKEQITLKSFKPILELLPGYGAEASICGNDFTYNNR